MKTPAASPEPGEGHFGVREVVAFATVTLIWGSTWLVIKDQISAVPPSWTIAYRFILASAAMFLVCLWRGSPIRLGRTHQLYAILIGLFQFSVNFMMVYRAESYVTSGLVAVLFALLMVPNAIMGRIFLGQKVNRNFFLGTAIAMAGIALLFVQEYRVMTGNIWAVLTGLAFAFAGMMGASVSNIMQAAPAVREVRPLTLIAWSMLWGALIDMSVALVLDGLPLFETRWSYFAGIAYLALIGSVITFPLYFTLIRHIGAGKAAYTSAAVPVVAMALSTAFEGYVWSPLAAGGAVLSLVGMVVAMRARVSKRRLPAQ